MKIREEYSNDNKDAPRNKIKKLEFGFANWLNPKFILTEWFFKVCTNSNDREKKSKMDAEV